MSISKEDTSVNHQPSPRHEGQQNNIRPNSQQLNDTNAQPMSNMKKDSEEQKAGRAHEQEQDKNVQQQEHKH